jgi:hypothetical protein
MGVNMQNFSPLQMYTTRSFNGLTESGQLSKMLLTEPEKVGSILSYAFGFMPEFNGNYILSGLTGGLGNVMEINNREYQWALHGQNQRAIEIVGNFGDGGSTPGINGTAFRVKFAERWFESTDNLASDNGTLVRVQGEPYQEGNGWVYTLQLTSGDSGKFIGSDQISPGARFSKRFSTVEAYSNKGGGTSYASPFQLKNQLTTLRKQYEVSRSASTDVLVFELPDPENPKKTTKMWTKYAEWTAMIQWAYEMEASMMYSEYNKNSQGYVNLQGENKRPVFTGAGLRQQISPANTRYYNQMTYDLLDGFLLDLSYAASKWGGNYKFMALTGKMGMRAFSDAIQEKFKSLGYLVTNDARFLAGGKNELIFEGDQFITARFPNGIELTVKEYPLYDDIVQNREVHPKTGKPIESYRFTIMNIGEKDGKPNLRKVVKKDSDMVMWYVGGSTDPMGNIAKNTSTMRSSGIDGYQVHFLSECGIMLADPTSCGELIFTAE